MGGGRRVAFSRLFAARREDESPVCLRAPYVLDCCFLWLSDTARAVIRRRRTSRYHTCSVFAGVPSTASMFCTGGSCAAFLFFWGGACVLALFAARRGAFRGCFSCACQAFVPLPWLCDSARAASVPDGRGITRGLKGVRRPFLKQRHVVFTNATISNVKPPRKRI